MIDKHQLGEASITVLATASTAVIAVVRSELNPDIVAALGAMLAAVIAMIEARKKDRSLGHTISVLIASAFVGCVVPGAAIWTWLPEAAPKLPWQAWAACGFVTGLLGWAFTAAVMALRSRVPGLVNSQADKFGLQDRERDN